IGRLIKNEQVGWPRQHKRKHQPCPFATRKLTYRCASLLRLKEKALHIGYNMTLFAIDNQALSAPIGNSMRQRGVELVPRALLVKLSNFQINTEPQGSRIRFQLPCQKR